MALRKSRAHEDVKSPYGNEKLRHGHEVAASSTIKIPHGAENLDLTLEQLVVAKIPSTPLLTLAALSASSLNHQKSGVSKILGECSGTTMPSSTCPSPGSALSDRYSRRGRSCTVASS